MGDDRLKMRSGTVSKVEIHLLLETCLTDKYVKKSIRTEQNCLS